MDNSSAMKSMATITAPPFICAILNWILFGVLSVQIYMYFQAFPRDRLFLKALVFTTYILDAFQTALITYTTWNMFVTGFGDVLGLEITGVCWLSVCVVEGCVALLVQSFYAHRIKVLSKNRVIPLLIMVLSLISFGGALASALQLKGAPVLSERLGTSVWFMVWIAVGSICDVIIVVGMCYYLRKSTQTSTFTNTQDFVNRFTLMTVQTGALTASVSSLSLIFYYYFSPEYFEVPLSSLAKIYSTTMLTVLNSRMKVGLFSDSATWLDNELGPREIVFNTACSDSTNCSTI